LSAHYENTILITNKGVEVLTLVWFFVIIVWLENGIKSLYLENNWCLLLK
jgi:hypothetical protein